MIHSFEEQIATEKAGQLDIPPRLLLIALTSLAEDEQITEREILSRYRSKILEDLKNEVSDQLRSNSKHARENAMYELSDARRSFVDLVREQSPAFNTIDEYVGEGETLKNYHLEAWNQINYEVLTIKNKYWKVLDKTDLADIIRLLCREEIENLRHMVV